MFFILVSAAIFGITYAAGTDVLTHVKDIVFTVVSMGTSTGFIVTDINGWMAVPAALAILFLMMIIGGSSGSTSGGLKIGRVVAILKSLTLDVKKRIHPRAVSDVKLGRETLDEGRISAAYILLTLFMVTIIAGYLGLLILEPSLDSESALMISMTSVSNTGFVGPYAGVGFAEFSGSSKVLLTLLMWIGRLEVGTAIIIFTPFFWKEVLRGGWKLRKMEGRSL
jgi:trk system potassium uptake protein TrkH